jgi:2-dehydro-3-deoxy-D-arabinonate dehydratase
VVFQGETSTAQMRRSPAELAGYLGRYNDFPHGALLFTGTGIVPGDDFSLRNGDEVAIDIEAIGVLRNSVQQM